MRAALAFLGVIFGTLLLAAALAWPAWIGIHALQPDWPFHRIVSRVWQLILLLAFLLAMRKLSLRGRDDWGYGVPRPAFLRQFAAGLGIGVATMLPMSIAMHALDIHELRPEFGATLLASAVAGGRPGRPRGRRHRGDLLPRPDVPRDRARIRASPPRPGARRSSMRRSTSSRA